MRILKKYAFLIRNISNWYQYFYVKFWNQKVDPVIFKTRSGVTLAIKREIMPIFKEIFMEDDYSKKWLKSTLPPKPTVLDIGANVGFFDLLIFSLFPKAKIFAFEPLPANYLQLTKNCQLNEDMNITCIQKAVADKNEPLTLFIEESQTLSANISVFENKNKKQKSIFVPAITLPTIFDEYNIKEIDLLKIDCEGAEYDILYQTPDKIFKKIHRMIIETHNGSKPKENFKTMLTFIQEKGFIIERTKRSQLIFATQAP